MVRHGLEGGAIRVEGRRMLAGSGGVRAEGVHIGTHADVRAVDTGMHTAGTGTRAESAGSRAGALRAREGVHAGGTDVSMQDESGDVRDKGRAGACVACTVRAWVGGVRWGQGRVCWGGVTGVLRAGVCTVLAANARRAGCIEKSAPSCKRGHGEFQALGQWSGSCGVVHVEGGRALSSQQTRGGQDVWDEHAVQARAWRISGTMAVRRGGRDRGCAHEAQAGQGREERGRSSSNLSSTTRTPPPAFLPPSSLASFLLNTSRLSTGPQATYFALSVFAAETISHPCPPTASRLHLHLSARVSPALLPPAPLPFRLAPSCLTGPRAVELNVRLDLVALPVFAVGATSFQQTSSPPSDSPTVSLRPPPLLFHTCLTSSIPPAPLPARLPALPLAFSRARLHSRDPNSCPPSNRVVSSPTCRPFRLRDLPRRAPHVPAAIRAPFPPLFPGRLISMFTSTSSRMFDPKPGPPSNLGHQPANLRGLTGDELFAAVGLNPSNDRVRTVFSFEGKIFVAVNTLEMPSVPDLPWLAFIPKKFTPKGVLLSSLAYNQRTIPLEQSDLGHWRLSRDVCQKWEEIERGIALLWSVLNKWYLHARVPSTIGYNAVFATREDALQKIMGTRQVFISYIAMMRYCFATFPKFAPKGLEARYHCSSEQPFWRAVAERDCPALEAAFLDCVHETAVDKMEQVGVIPKWVPFWTPEQVKLARREEQARLVSQARQEEENIAHLEAERLAHFQPPATIFDSQPSVGDHLPTGYETYQWPGQYIEDFFAQRATQDAPRRDRKKYARLFAFPRGKKGAPVFLWEEDEGGWTRMYIPCSSVEAEWKSHPNEAKQYNALRNEWDIADIWAPAPSPVPERPLLPSKVEGENLENEDYVTWDTSFPMQFSPVKAGPADMAILFDLATQHHSTLNNPPSPDRQSENDLPCSHPDDPAPTPDHEVVKLRRVLYERYGFLGGSLDRITEMPTFTWHETRISLQEQFDCEEPLHTLVNYFIQALSTTLDNGDPGLDISMHDLARVHSDPGIVPALRAPLSIGLEWSILVSNAADVLLILHLECDDLEDLVAALLERNVPLRYIEEWVIDKGTPNPPTTLALGWRPKGYWPIFYLWENALTEAERELICGTYHISTGAFFFLCLTAWHSCGFNTSSWTSNAELWYQRRLLELEGLLGDQDQAADPLLFNAHIWKQNMRKDRNWSKHLA
ncbi:hypothetical protein OF83DRAFT_1084827 [Amylostereum chailletii]|nr:hypothetical protein OF83DRAFT_1084827 [Amylostereum chailletii]